MNQLQLVCIFTMESPLGDDIQQNVSLTETSGGGTRKFPLKRGVWMWLGPSLSVLKMCVREVRLHLKKYIYVIPRLGGQYWAKLCPRSWLRPRAVLRPRAQFLPIRNDLGRWITFLFFFLLRFKSFRKILLQPPTYVCWRRARSCWCSKRAIDCKPKQNIATWFLNL